MESERAIVLITIFVGSSRFHVVFTFLFNNDNDNMMSNN